MSPVSRTETSQACRYCFELCLPAPRTTNRESSAGSRDCKYKTHLLWSCYVPQYIPRLLHSVKFFDRHFERFTKFVFHTYHPTMWLGVLHAIALSLSVCSVHASLPYSVPNLGKVSIYPSVSVAHFRTKDTIDFSNETIS